jgi:hypothetical protein
VSSFNENSFGFRATVTVFDCPIRHYLAHHRVARTRAYAELTGIGFCDDARRPMTLLGVQRGRHIAVRPNWK